ncbi:MAG: AtpZ/AtpI family protein [Armatimonadota bacterium]|nr:AtpZ/AtpI family protein [Armatimonadota bacterium]
MRGSDSPLMKGAGYWLLAWSIPLSIIIGYGVGWWLDELLGTEPWLQVVGFLLGAAAGLAQILQLMRNDDE